MAVFVSSQRLYLRQASADDWRAFFAMDEDPEVMRHIADGATRHDPAHTHAAIERIIAAYARKPGLGLWSCCLADSQRCIGWFALKPCQLAFPLPAAPAATPPPAEERIEVGYRLLREHWGHGYATEMTIELLRHGFATLQLPSIVAACKPANVASSRVLQKAGLAYQGRGDYGATRVDVYAATQQEWLKRSGG